MVTPLARRLVRPAGAPSRAAHTVDGIQFLPRPAQWPGVPVSAAGLAGNVKPLHRAARYQGFFPFNLGHANQLAEAAAAIAGLHPTGRRTG